MIGIARHYRVLVAREQQLALDDYPPVIYLASGTRARSLPRSTTAAPGKRSAARVIGRRTVFGYLSGSVTEPALDRLDLLV